MDKIFDKINLIYGFIVVVLAAIFGDFWYLFVSFLALNIVDYITGVLKARYTHKENSVKGAKGIVKKVGYWIVVGIAFFMSAAFIELGNLMGIDLSLVMGLGWLTLGTFIINEIRSILENLVLLDVPVPEFLTKGLEVMDKAIKKKTEKENEL